MSKEQLVSRVISSEVLIEMEKMRKGNLEDEDWKELANAVGVLSKARYI